MDTAHKSIFQQKNEQILKRTLPSMLDKMCAQIYTITCEELVVIIPKRSPSQSHAKPQHNLQLKHIIYLKKNR